MHEWYKSKSLYIGNPDQTRHLSDHHKSIGRRNIHSTYLEMSLPDKRFTANLSQSVLIVSCKIILLVTWSCTNRTIKNLLSLQSVGKVF